MSELNENVVALFKESLNDYILSRAERKNLKYELENLKPSIHEKRVLWSEVKKLALAHAQDHQQEMVLNWMYDCFKILQTETANASKTRVLFSPGTACRETICSQIRWAKSDLLICVFTISDNEITEELLAAHRNGKKIRIITDNDKTDDMGSDIDRLADAGIAVLEDKTDAHMHHKFALFDSETVLTGSYNWTRSAAERNHENLLVTENPKTFRAYKKEFERLWKELKD
jgi:phosphatidylserine/phosphatidylglycerophosphate/cardiolipin synthase-like enzyme